MVRRFLEAGGDVAWIVRGKLFGYFRFGGDAQVY
jgi:hypothetical protein